MVIAIYGMGLIGGSLGRAIIKKTPHTVLGCDTDRAAIIKAKLLNACHEELTEESLATADMVVLAVNPNTAIAIMEEITPKLKSGATVIDCCGTKRKVTAAMEKLNASFPEIDFAGAHPMAGREFSGIAHSTAGLYERAYVIITPVHTPMSALVKVKRLFAEIGCVGLVTATAQQHDRIIAYTSQLAHIISSAYVKSPLSASHLGFSAGSFRDLTRVAKLNSVMWTELFMDNSDNLIAEIEILEKNLAEYKSALISKDAALLKALLDDGVAKKEFADNLIKGRNS